MRSRANYGILGTAISLATTGGAGGIFNMADQSTAKGAGYWPGTPVLTINGVSYNLAAGPYQSTTNGYYLISSTSICTYRIQLWGAGGGTTNINTSPGIGGAGGYVEGQISLPAGNYVLLIGQGGLASGAATFPDGAAVQVNNNQGSSGGGSTRFGPYTQSGFNITNSSANYNNTNAIYYLIAGGGGSATTNNSSGTGGGFGGGTNGAAGGLYYSADTASSVGGGATQSAGGSAGTGGRIGTGNAGAKYAAGSGYYSSGGGGYYGGGGAMGYYSQSGGGSGYINSGSITSGTFYTASTGTSAYVSPDPRTNKLTNAGNGGQYGVNSSNGYDGAIIITYLP